MTSSNSIGRMPLMRTEIGEVLRGVRSAQHRTLRDVAKQANVSLGYLSEVERGQKEASSELLEAICQALGLPLWALLREVSNRMVLRAQFYVPDTVPDDLLDSRTIRIVPDARTESNVALKV